MSKPRSDSTFNLLAPEQRQKLHAWLFEENIGYKEAKKRVQDEFNLSCSINSLYNFYTRQAAQPIAERAISSAFTARAFLDAGVDSQQVREAAMGIITQRVLDHAIAQGDPKDLTELGRLMLQSEERGLQRQKLELARDRFEYRAAKAAMKILPELDAMKREDEEREDQRIVRIKKQLFGDK